MFKKIFSSQLRINMFSGVATTTVNTVVMAVSYPVYLYFLGYEKYGVWLVLATVLTFVQLGNLGIGPAVMKLVAEEYGRGDIEAVRRYITAALVLLCISGTVALIALLTFKSQIITLFKLSDENAKTVSWLLPYVGVLSIYVFVVQVFDAALSGMGRMDLSNYIQSAGRIAAVIVAAVLLYSGRGIESLLIASIASYLLIHIASIICIWRIAPIRFLRPSSFDTQRCKRLLHFGGAILGSSLINMLLNPFNKLMLSRFVGVSAIPVYDIAFNGSVQVRAMIEATLRPLMPEISRITGKGTLSLVERIRHINKRAMMLIVGGGVPLYVVLFAASTLLTRLWLGEQFNDNIPSAFRLMLIVTFLSLLGVPAYHTLLGLGWARCSLVSAIIISGGNFILVIITLLAGRTISVNSIFGGLIFVSAISVIYLMNQASKEIKAMLLDCRRL